MMAGPVLARIGYGLTWQNAVILCWGGLRGAVGLALALQVALDYKSVGSKVGKHFVSIVSGMVTIIYNCKCLNMVIKQRETFFTILGFTSHSWHRNIHVIRERNNHQETARVVGYE